MVDTRLKDNYYALILCILTTHSVDKSLNVFGLRINSKNNKTLTKDDNLAMLEFKRQGMSYREIGERYGITSCAAQHRIRGIKDEQVPL
jgi:hypothetical protein